MYKRMYIKRGKKGTKRKGEKAKGVDKKMYIKMYIKREHKGVPKTNKRMNKKDV